jgi:membrane protein DedA with SNARE-associated domain
MVFREGFLAWNIGLELRYCNDIGKAGFNFLVRLHEEHSFHKGSGLSVCKDLLKGEGKHMTLEYLISHYGYVALIIGTFLEGESILIVAGFAVHLGYLKLQWVILSAFAGSVAGDQLYFFLGRVKGEAFLQKRPRWKTKINKVWKLLDRYRTLLILGFRFAYGLRTVTPFAIGLSNIRASRFLVLNVIGGLCWSVVVALVGYFFGAAALAVFVDVKKYEHWIVIGILLGASVVWIIYFLRERKKDRAEHRS